MQILAISYDEKKSWFSFRMEEGVVFAVSYPTYLRLNLQVGDMVDGNDLKVLREEDETNRAHAVALRYATYKRRTRKEVIRRLQKEGIRRVIIMSVLQKLDELPLLDDARYARDYVKEKSELDGWSRRKTEAMLYKKGISSSDIASALTALSEEKEEENVRRALYKRYGHLDFTIRKNYEKAYRGLLNQGFQSSAIRPLLEEMREEAEKEI